MSVKKKGLLRAIKNRGHYTIVPNEILTAKELSSNEKLIWSYILSQPHYWTGGRNSIASNLGISPKTVTSVLRSLVSNGLIEIDTSREKFSFTFPTPDKWKIALELPQAEEETTPEPEEKLPHIKEEKTTRASEPISPTQEDKFLTILTEWRNNYPSGPSFLSGKRKSVPALRLLVKKSQAAGLKPDEMKVDLLVSLIFGNAPDDSLDGWIRDIGVRFSEQVRSVYSLQEQSSALCEYDDAEVERILSDLKQRGITAEKLGMPIREHAINRAYAEQFPTLNTDELVKKYRESKANNKDGPLENLEEEILGKDD